jgi:hypothetical protein
MEKEHIKMAMLKQEQTFRQQVNHASDTACSEVLSIDFRDAKIVQFFIRFMSCTVCTGFRSS